MWKTFALFSGAILQLAVAMVVFGFLGHLLAQKWHQVWLNIIGVLVGVVVGSAGFGILAKQLLGGKSRDR